MTKNSIRAVYASPLTVVRLLLFFSLLACAGHLSAAIRYVRATPTGSGDGSNWDNASNNLQAMITASTIGDEVWVAKGTYQRANSGEYFSMKEGVKIYGGFEGDELSLDERDLANTSNASILKGNSYNVIKNDGNGLTNAAVLDGFTITGGVGDNNLGGGGIYNNNASPMLINCSITGNRAGDYGGGVSNRYSSPTLINCSITANTSDYGDGGGMFNRQSAPKLVNCSFTDNYAEYGGSAMYNSESASVLINCSILNNSTNDGGGAFKNIHSPSITLTNCSITGNIGGVMFNVNSSPTLTNCTICNNTNSNDNSAFYSAGSSSLKLRNTILYGNDVGIINRNDSSTEIHHSLIQGITSTDNSNISGDTDPLFVDPANGEYRLQPCSPVINKGSNTYYASGQTPDLTAINTDLDGEPRFYASGTVDMGAYEYQAATATFTGVFYVKAGGTGTGTSWDCPMGDLQAAINSAGSGQQVWVAKGNYQRSNSGEYFRMKNNVKIYGGFKGGETSVDQRDLTNTADASILQGNGTHVVYNNSGIEASALLDGFTITGGSGDFGGGIRNLSASPTIQNCIITNNAVNYHGAGMYNASSSPILINCKITGNKATSLGGGIYNTDSAPRYTNCSFSDNIAVNGGAIFITVNSTATLTNCTLTGNTASNGTGGISNNSSTLTVRNSIVYGNSSGINAGDISHSLVQGMTSTDNGNISGDTDPLFVDAANGDYRLQPCSPALNKGSNTYYASGQIPDLSAITTDLEGKARFYNNGTVDLGAYELEYNTAIIYVKEGGTGPGTSWDCAAGDLQGAINAANSGDEVWVAGGIYKRTVAPGYYSMKEGVKIYGGFEGNETSLSQRDLTKMSNASTLQGSTSVVKNMNNDLTPAAVLDGFTISGGFQTGVYNSSVSPTFRNCIITGNFTGSFGGGVYNLNSSPVLVNCVISGNTASFGGGLFNEGGSPLLINCTISGNTDFSGVGGMYNGSSSPKLLNTIVYGNSGGIYNNASSPDIRNSLVQGITSADNGNISGNTDPLFVDAANGDYRLQPCSPVINKGSNAYYESGQTPDLSAITTDLVGEARFYANGTVDMGAYEFVGTASTPTLAIHNDEFTQTISGNSLIGVNGSACTVIASLIPNGSAPLSGDVTAKVWIETTQPQNFVKRHYQITPTNGVGTTTAKVTLYFTQQEFTDFNAANSTKLPINAEDTKNYKANLRIEKRAGKSKDDDSGLPGTYDGAVETINPLDPAVNGSISWNTWASRWEVSFDVTGFSGFFVKTIDSPLPLNLLSFTGTKEKGANLLNWKTASELNTLNFEVQSSTDAKNFTKIGTVTANGSGNHQYSYQDATPYYCNVYYRLKMNDRDGSFAYSKIISLTNGEVSPAMVYPNPATESITLTVPPTLFQSTATLYDVTGRLLQSIIITANMQQVSIKSLRSGVYILKLADGTTQRFVKE